MIRGILEQLTGPQMWIVCIGIGIILIWLGLIILKLYEMLNKYTLGSNGSENPYRNETLGMPPGTLRAVLTLTIMVVVIVLVCVSMLVEPLKGSYDEMLTAFEIVLAFYFGGRILNSISEKDQLKAKSRYDAEAERARAEAEITSAHMFNNNASTPTSKDPFEVKGSVG